MSVLRLTVGDAEVLERPGKRSAQIVSRKNAPNARITVTRVEMQPGGVSPLHRHQAAEQTWLVERGRAHLLTTDGPAQVLVAGDVVVTPPGEVHGLETLGDAPFIYLTVTTPPEDMADFYTSPEQHARRIEEAARVLGRRAKV